MKSANMNTSYENSSLWKSNRKGMSLVEILVALAVVVTIFTPIIAMVSLATIRAYRGGDETVATIYANDVLEIIRGAPYESFMPNDTWMNMHQILYEHNIPTGYELEKYEKRFIVAAKVSEVEGYPPQLMKQVTVEVKYEPRIRQKKKANQERTVVLTSFYTPSK